MPSLAPTSETADELLRALAGPDAVFREHQREAVEDLVVGRRRVLCVQRTGWGKSAVYFLATAALRGRSGAGPDGGGGGGAATAALRGRAGASAGGRGGGGAATALLRRAGAGPT